MTDESVQGMLDRILADLKSDDTTRQLAAFHELETIKYSSEAIVVRLEQLAIYGEGAVKNLALAALCLKTSQFTASKLSSLPKTTRQIILNEIVEWQEDRLIEADRAEVIRRHYDFDIRPGVPVKASVPKTEQGEIKPAAKAITTPASQTAQAPAIPVKPAAPRPSLMQSLLSEFSIRIYLYLGAFFVIVAAAILAALVEAARLPILLIATLAFAGGAVVFRKRLPQPSFAFAIVFSFLLPIDAAVMADTMNLHAATQHWFWFGMYVVMAAIWAGGTWLYESRLFSMASFVAMILGAYRLDLALDASYEWILLSLGVIGLAGLIGSQVLKKWKGLDFTLPLYLIVHGLQVFTLAGSILAIGINLFEPTLPHQWIALTLVWLIGASFYAASDFITPVIFFPWAAVASLFLVPWLLLTSFHASAPAMIAGFWFWGALIGILSEVAWQVKNATVNRYHFPLLAISFPLFLVSVVWAIVENNYLAFGALLGTGIIYTVVHAMRPRWYVWTTALIAGLGAYFSFFVLPVMMETFVYFGFQLLIASLFLLVPELFFKNQPLGFSRPWNWPPVALGTLLTGFNLLFVLIGFGRYPALGEKSIIFGAYALLLASYAWRFAQPQIGYLATASAAVCVVFALNHFGVDLWLPALTILSVIYFGAGYLLARNERSRNWGAMLINSGLALGTTISAMAVLALQPTGGWYALIIAALFAVELYTRRNSWLELFVGSLISVALIIVLHDFNVRDVTYYLFGLSLVWLTTDAILHLTFQDRNEKAITWLACGALTFAAVGAILVTGLASASAAICFSVYTVFFAVYALLYKEPLLGYLSTASAAVTMFFTLDTFKIETWLPIFTALALVYYLAGFLTRKRIHGWSAMLRLSGLGLGTLLALVELILVQPTAGWYALIIGAAFLVETVSTRNGWFEAGVHGLFSIAAFLLLRDFNLDRSSFILLALSLVWLGGDAAFLKGFRERTLGTPVQFIGLGLSLLNGGILLGSAPDEAAICYGVYALFFALYALLRANPTLGYLSTISLPLAIYFGMRDASLTWWIFPLIGIAVVYYGAGYVLRTNARAKGWESVLLISGLGLGTMVALTAPFQTGGIEKALPIAVAATLFAAEAFAKRNVWLAFPANAVYLISYFTLLLELKVEEAQYFSIGAAILGMVMHFLLVRAKSRTGAFIMGTLSQLTLLGTTYIQMVSTERLAFFFVIFAQSLAVLVYGIVMRSRSLVIAPIGFAVLATVTVLYSALKDLSIVLIVGVTGIVLLMLGILAVLMRERITNLAERFSDWSA